MTYIIYVYICNIYIIYIYNVYIYIYVQTENLKKGPFSDF